MPQPRASASEGPQLLRSLPVLLAALLAVIGAADLLLIVQPALLDRWSHAFRSAVSLRPVLSPVTHVLAASLAIACVVLSSAAAIFVARAVRAAPHVTIAPAWISLCMLSAGRVDGPLPLPMSTPLFIALSAVLFIAASTLLRSGSRPGGLLGWAMLGAPFFLFALPYISGSGAHAFGADGWALGIALVLSAAGAIGAAFVRGSDEPVRGPREVKGLEGVDMVEELFAQVERAERSEARAAELERKLAQYEPPGRGTLRRVR